MSGPLKIAVAGLRRGRGFAKLCALRDDCRVAAVCDANRERADDFARTLGVLAVYDYDALCRLDLDAVVVATPPATHFECTVKALRNGKHVLCEVPAVMTLDEAAGLRDAVAQTGRKYMIAENVNYFPVIQEMHRIVRAGQIGDIVLAEGEYVHDCRAILYNRDDGLGGGTADKPSWRSDLEPIRYSTHELGPILMILDDRIISVACFDSTAELDGQADAIRTQIALFRTAKGRTIRELTAFKIARRPEHHFFCLYGTRGSVETDRYRWYENLKVYSEIVPGDPSANVLADRPTSLVHANVPEKFRAGGHGTSEYFLVDDFVRAILDDTTPPLDVGKALAMTVPGICAAESARNGGQRVMVPEYGTAKP